MLYVLNSGGIHVLSFTRYARTQLSDLETLRNAVVLRVNSCP